MKRVSFLWLVFAGVVFSLIGSVGAVEEAEVIHGFPMDSNPGWQTEGQWAFGQPQGVDGDPSAGFTGANVYGYNLAGKYQNNIPQYWLTTPALDCSGFTNVVLNFQRWLQVEYSGFDEAEIQVSTDGTTWEPVWAHTGSAIQDVAWQEMSYDISAVADDASTVYLRWGMGPTDGSVTYCGWNIDDVELKGIRTESLRISPASTLVVEGYENHGFVLSNQVYSLTNTGAASLTWAANTTASWLAVSPTNGVLVAGGGAQVTVSIDPVVGTFPPGTMVESVVFSNTASSAPQLRDVQLVVKERVLDHFEWEPMGPAQILGQDFPVVITAKDGAGDVFPGFTGTTLLLGLHEGAELSVGYTLGSPVHMWSGNTGNFTFANAFTPSEALTVSHVRHYFGTKISIWTEVGQLIASQNVTSVPGTWVETALPEPVVLEAGVRYRIGVYSGGDVYYSSDGLPSEFQHGAIHQSYQTTGDTFPRRMDFARWWFVDLRYTAGAGEAVPLDPANTGNFVSGVWSGSVAVLETATNLVLRASDGIGHSGDSHPFNVFSPKITVHVAPSAVEGDVLTGEITVDAIPLSDLEILLVSDNPTAATVATRAIIPAGQTNTTLSVQTVDDGFLNGTRGALITASATNHLAGSAAVLIHDNEVATLTLSLPQTTDEGAGTIAGSLGVSAPPDMDVTVALISNNPEKIASSSLVIPAGQTSVFFALPVLDNAKIDGVQTATIEARVQNWISSQSSVFVVDNETNELELQLPASVVEGDGVVTNSGTVSLSGVTMTDIHVTLTSSDVSEMTVPVYVTIPNGQSSASFDITVVDDAEMDGAQQVNVLAQSVDYVAAAESMEVWDNDVHHLTISGPAGNPAVLDPVPLSVAAETIDDRVVATFSNTVSLTASGDDGNVPVTPDNTPNFAGGTWSGDVVFGALANNVTLTAADGAGHSVTSTVFNVLGSRIVLNPNGLTNTLVVAGETLIRTLVISNAGNADLEFEIQRELPEVEDPSLLAYFPFNGNADDATGNGHDGTVNGATLATDRFGNADRAYGFDGTNDFIELGIESDFDFDRTNAFSQSFWIRTEGLGDDPKIIFSKLEETGYVSYLIENQLIFFLTDGDNSAAAVVPQALNDNQWYHIAIIYDGSSQSEGITIYVDGTSALIQPIGNSLTTSTLNDVIPTLGALNGGLNFSGKIDDFRMYTRTLEASEVSELHNEGSDAGGSGDQESSLVAHFPFNGNATDESGNGHDGTINGATLTTDRFGNADSAYSFDGVNNYISVSDHEDFTVTNVTVAAWVKTSDKSDYRHITSCYGTGHYSDWYNLYLTSGSGLARWAVDIGGSGTIPVSIGTSDLADDQWHFVVGVRDVDTSELKVYVDGVLQSTAADVSSEALNPEVDFWIGGQNGWPARFFNGVIDDVSIYNRALSDEEISDLYRAAGEDGLIAHFSFDGNADDESGNGHHGTEHGTFVYGTGIKGGSAQFNGSNAYVSVPHSDDLSLDGIFSIGVWVKSSGTNPYSGLVSKILPSLPRNGYLLTANYVSSGVKIAMTQYTMTGGGGVGTTNNVLDGEWHHITVTYDEENFRLYVDGLLVEESTYTDGLDPNTVPLYLGLDPYNAVPDNRHFNGEMDELRIYNRVLSDSEVSELYHAAGEDSLVAHFPFNGNAADESGNGHDGTVNGATLTVDRFGNADRAYLFDGTDDYIEVPDHSDLRLSDTSFTISTWLKETSRNPTYQGALITKRGSGTVNGWFYSSTGTQASMGAGKAYYQVSGGFDPLGYTAAMVPMDTWNHSVITYDLASQTLRFYINGVLDSEHANIPSPNPSTAVNMFIGLDSLGRGYAFHGALDDIRIYNRALSDEDITELYLDDGLDELETSLFAASPTEGVIPPGSNMTLSVAFDASGLVAGDYANDDFWVICNDAFSPTNTLPVSMWIVPPAPQMMAEPELTEGASNTVHWSAVAGPVDYLVEISTDTNAVVGSDSGWVAATNHTFDGLTTNTVYYYHVKASVPSGIGLLESEWSDWVWSSQVPSLTDRDGNGLADWWERAYFNGTGIDPLLDPDGDGQNNRDEFITGMDPTNAASFFGIRDFDTAVGDAFVVRWDSVTGRVYSVYWKTNMLSSFLPLETDIHHPRNSYTDRVHNVENQGFYSIEVELD